MVSLSESVRKRLTTIITDEYEDCQFFAASAQMLVNKIKEISLQIQDPATQFEKLKDEIGQIGIFLSNAEKRLQEVEDCYTKLVETLSEDNGKS